jgi:hypothetical protein
MEGPIPFTSVHTATFAKKISNFSFPAQPCHNGFAILEQLCGPFLLGLHRIGKGLEICIEPFIQRIDRRHLSFRHLRQGIYLFI